LFGKDFLLINNSIYTVNLVSDVLKIELGEGQTLTIKHNQKNAFNPELK